MVRTVQLQLELDVQMNHQPLRATVSCDAVSCVITLYGFKLRDVDYIQGNMMKLFSFCFYGVHLAVK